MTWTIRKVYLYITSFIGLILIIIGSVQLVNLGLKTWVFTKADQPLYDVCPQPRLQPEAPEAQNTTFESQEECEEREKETRSANRQRQAATAISMILVGTPVYWYHWRKIKDEKDV